ncbi:MULTISPECIES: complex I subunit 5 family protein [unclassified Arsukibacterium]|uniref:complex I subunit 5 family protein n=1 Tax=unclassified Arsukibacterium TaxID=2635278 RepID=UPI000C61F277|nr:MULTISPECIES: proton-conducting transporter membrane subunit [unclassified Arsukibacterium]MAA96215.1 NADH-quinone oxidoreductase subunit J [Rheinheimera sp.]MBM35038.1 NADH-quinone oxidoreductase subunit J [Rheinheimera sp.]HAW92410.1 NADH-quinone oxidoreductase subunit J [Candidatus Azambacteria bacterium]|tara:strand:- start:10981 stop:12396 length:1416 start_codon:yes stop_codon:yes gene_type:complete
MIIVLLLVPLLSALLMLLWPRIAPLLALLSAAVSSLFAAKLLLQVNEQGTLQWLLAGWPTGLAISWQADSLSCLLILLCSILQLLVGFYAFATRARDQLSQGFWPLSTLLQLSLTVLWLSRDLFNLYVCLELLGLVAVALVSLSGGKAFKPALNYLLLSLFGSLCYLLGVVLLYAVYGLLDIKGLAQAWQADWLSSCALLLMSLGLMLKAALWPLHAWLPAAHAAAPAPVSALLSALVVKGPLFILCLLWLQLASVQQAQLVAPLFAGAGLAALLFGGWSALRTPFIKNLVAYSTVAQLGYATLALGLMLKFDQPLIFAALWLFVLAHALAKAACFLAVGEMSATLGGKRLTIVKGASQTMPLAMFAFAVAGGSLIGLPPSGGFVAKWALLQGLWLQGELLLWPLALVLATLLSAAYVFRVVVVAFDRADPVAPDFAPQLLPQWLALLPALAVWAMAMFSEPLLLLLRLEA